NKLVKSWTVDTYYGYTITNDSGDIQWVETTTGISLYQIPIIRAKDLPYGQYEVTVMPSYTQVFDHNKNNDGEKRGYYDFYLDAVRIYSPANADTEKNNEVIKEA